MATASSGNYAKFTARPSDRSHGRAGVETFPSALRLRVFDGCSHWSGNPLGRPPRRSDAGGDSSCGCRTPEPPSSGPSFSLPGDAWQEMNKEARVVPPQRTHNQLRAGK